MKIYNLLMQKCKRWKVAADGGMKQRVGTQLALRQRGSAGRWGKMERGGRSVDGEVGVERAASGEASRSSRRDRCVHVRASARNDENALECNKKCIDSQTAPRELRLAHLSLHTSAPFKVWVRQLFLLSSLNHRKWVPYNHSTCRIQCPFQSFKFVSNSEFSFPNQILLSPSLSLNVYS